MKFYSTNFILFLLFSLVLSKIALAETFQADYKITLGGINIGKLSWILNIEKNYN